MSSSSGSGRRADYEDERFTLDPSYVEAVVRVFVALYEKGYIYRDRYMVNWDPGSGSAVSDLEVEDRDVVDTLYYIDYPLESGAGSITVATVRPETMLADTAIAVHPDDDRYRRLIGEHAILPLVGRRLKIIADEYVKPDFGTGALKITPGHDPNDFEIGNRHGLERISVIGEDGRITDAAPERFVGMTTAEAQKAIVAELDDLGLIARAEEYTHSVPFSQRSGERIEPLISLQWFMRMDELAKPAMDAVKSGRIRFHPERWTKVYLDWMENIRPWCISRQLWWGHQIPVWYRDGEAHAGATSPPGDGWERDEDVLDTWFSSGLWPFATLGWPEQTPELTAFYPTDVLSTGRDIIFLWVARMIMMGIEFAGEIPFDDVHIHAIIQAPDGRRQSKSLGTGIDPLDLIDGGPRPPVFSAGGEFPPYGADAVRWGLLAMSSGQDVKFAEDKIAQAQQLTNKLWNASRLILLRVDPRARAVGAPLTVEDRWILSRLQRARPIGEAIEELRVLARSARPLRLRLRRAVRLVPGARQAAPLRRGDRRRRRHSLLHVLVQTLALAHPVIPFVTEEIYGYIPGAEGLLAARVASPGGSEVDGVAAEAIGGARDRGGAGAPRVARWRRGQGPGATVDARLSPAICTTETAETSPARLGRLNADTAQRCHGRRVDPCAGRRHRGAGLRRARPRRCRPEARGQASRARIRDQARRGQTRKCRLRRQGPTRRRPGRAGQARCAARGARVALTVALTASEAERRLLSLELFGMRFGLDRMRRLMTVLDHPERAFRSVHVVGTNGKSSTVRMLSGILTRHGHRTGAYLSPHLISFCERIRVDDEDISPDRFAAAIERALRAADHVNRGAAEGDVVTQFELLTAAAYSELAARGVEFAVIEAGLGGRYDATNVISSEVQVLTSVGLDHTRWLGSEIADIAREKLDVVQPGAVLVLGPGMHPNAESVAEQIAAGRGATMIRAGADPGVPVARHWAPSSSEISQSRARRRRRCSVASTHPLWLPLPPRSRFPDGCRSPASDR